MGATMTVEEIATATDTEVAATVVVVMVVAADMEVDMTTGKKSCVLCLLLRLRLHPLDLKSYPGVVVGTTAVAEGAVGKMTMTIQETDTITREMT